MASQDESGGSQGTSIDDETQPLLLYTQPYCPPPVPLSPEDIAQRRRSLGIESICTGADALSLNSASFEASSPEISRSCGHYGYNPVDQQRQQRVYDERGCVEDSCVYDFCC